MLGAGTPRYRAVPGTSAVSPRWGGAAPTPIAQPFCSAIGFEGGSLAVNHLMIAGGLHLREPVGKLNRKRTLLGLRFDAGIVPLTDPKFRDPLNSGNHILKRILTDHDDMAVHGRFGKLCPECALPIQWIVYASSETNECSLCQTPGGSLADRALSRLPTKDRPKSVEAFEYMKPDAPREPKNPRCNQTC